MASNAVHWADIAAERIVREKGEKDTYVCASGITPSGTVHIGNFREIISVELVVRALRDMGKTVRFIYSWDDYDVFRKVPANMPDGELLKGYLRQSITRVPDPFGKTRSYAEMNEKSLEAVMPKVGVFPEYLYQSEKYLAAAYADGIRTALEKRDTIRAILDEHRTSPLPENWSPVSVFCSACHRDTTRVLDWDGEWTVRYVCDSCGNVESVDFRKPSGVKLPWRIDWPMRWKYEDVDFEPAGKEHHSAGGSFDTAKQVSQQVYGQAAPVTFKYDFISIKGMGGKISSSLGNVLSVDDVLQVYQPEIVRYLFAGTRPNVEFAISFDLDVIKIYEDYDRTERVYFGMEEVGEKKRALERRVYELSQITSIPERMPLQVAFRHLCNLLQIHAGDIDRTLEGIEDAAGEDLGSLRIRARCAWNWITTHAPEDFRFSLRDPGEAPVELSDAERAAVVRLRGTVSAELAEIDEKILAEKIYQAAQDNGIDPKDFFTIMYRILLGKEKGPRLAGFLKILGTERVISLLQPY